MGQYYKPINLDKKQFLYSHDFNNGLKLMEHSWLGNKFVDVIERLLIPGGLWHMTKLVWAGDYAEQEQKKDKTDKGYNLYDLCYSSEYYESKKEYLKELRANAKQHEKKTIYVQEKQLFEKIIPEKSKKVLGLTYPFVVNHTKKEFIDKRKGVESTFGWKIHPLPLMTCEGNGQGGGDFFGESNLVGSWARNVISIEKKAPVGYKEIIFDLKE